MHRHHNSYIGGRFTVVTKNFASQIIAETFAQMFEEELLTFVPIALSCEQRLSRESNPVLHIQSYLLDDYDDDDDDGSNRSGVPSLRQNCNQ